MQKYPLDYYGFSNEDADGCMAVFVDFPDAQRSWDTFEESKTDACEALENYFKTKDKKDGNSI